MKASKLANGQKAFITMLGEEGILAAEIYHKTGIS